MGKAIPAALRSEVVRLCKTGLSVFEVSQKLDLGYPGVAKIWRQYRKYGEQALVLGYDRCGRHSSFSEMVKEAIDKALSENQELGAPIIRSRLIAGGKFSEVPHERTIQRWWEASGKNKPRGRRPKSDLSYAREPHATWQIDGKENVALANGVEVCYLSFTDESTCSFLRGHVFPLRSSDETSEP
jgi:hypothetical protein